MLKDEQAGYFQVEETANGHRFVGGRCTTCSVTEGVYERGWYGLPVLVRQLSPEQRLRQRGKTETPVEEIRHVLFPTVAVF